MSMDETTHISAVVKTCRDLFDAVQADPAMVHHPWLRSAQGDFNLWCAATKAIGTGKSSLSYCLRDKAPARNTICGLILALTDSVRICYKALNGQNPERYTVIDVVLTVY